MRRGACTIVPMSASDDFTPIEAAAIAKKLFGEQFNLFHCNGVWYAGRFLDAPVERRGERAGKEELPWRRKQELFGAGRTLREALRFAVGRRTTFSIPGMRPGLNDVTGYVPVFDRFGRPVGFHSPTGVLHKTFPSAKIITA